MDFTMQEELKPILYKDMKVFVAIPVMDKKPFLNCHQSLMNAMQILIGINVPFQFEYEGGLPYISMARNNLERKFMESDCTDMIFIDADVGFSPGAFHDLIISTEEVIGGAYPKKQDSEEYACRLKKDEQGNAIVNNGVMMAAGLATGFLKIKRSALEKMRASYPEMVYDDGMTGKETFDFFGEFRIGRRKFHDDYGFCHLWEQIGGSMWVLPNITFTHSGSKDFKGNLHEYLVRPRVGSIVKAMKIDGFMTEDELTWLYDTAQQMGSVVEVGSWKGKSTTALLEGCKGPVLAVDNWTGHDTSSNGALEREAHESDVFAEFKANVGHYKNLAVFKGDSKDAAEQITADADMVFIDGDHTYEGCKSDIESWLPKCKKLIAFHDFNNAWPGVMKAVNEKFGIVKTIGSIAYVEVNKCEK